LRNRHIDKIELLVRGQNERFHGVSLYRGPTAK
jgi:hypothetical protein